MRRKNQMHFSEAINFWIYSLGLEEKFFQFELIEVWKEIMQKICINNTYKIQLKKNIAIIYLDSMLLVTNLNDKKEIVKNKINKKLKKFQLSDLYFKFYPKKIKL